MKALLTGAAGFIGMHTALRLLARGDEVIGVDKLNDYYEVRLNEARLDRLTRSPQFHFHKISVEDREGMARLFQRHKPQRVIPKGVANGFAAAALVGRREIMEAGAINKPGQERTFLVSTTHGGEMASLAALLECVAVSTHLWDYGAKLITGLEQVAREAGVAREFQLQGNAISMNYVTFDCNGEPSLSLRTLFSRDMIRNGVLMPWVAQSSRTARPNCSRRWKPRARRSSCTLRGSSSASDDSCKPRRSGRCSASSTEATMQGFARHMEEADRLGHRLPCCWNGRCHVTERRAVW